MARYQYRWSNGHNTYQVYDRVSGAHVRYLDSVDDARALCAKLNKGRK